jgi:rhombotail lipoprotein
MRASPSFPRRLSATIALTCTLALAGCGAASNDNYPRSPSSAPPPPPPVLTHSLYGPGGSISEADLQTSLGSAIDLQFPARLGIVPLGSSFDPKAKVTPNIRRVAIGELGKALVGSEFFTQLSDVDVDLPNVGGIEGLRAIAARYRVRYLLLYSQEWNDSTHLNGWAFSYATVVGMFLVPGVTVESSGWSQATLLDVRTGTILFSVAEPLHVHSKTFMIGAKRTHEEEQDEAAAAAAPALAKRVHAQTAALVELARNAAQTTPKTLYLPPPVVVGR